MRLWPKSPHARHRNRRTPEADSESSIHLSQKGQRPDPIGLLIAFGISSTTQYTDAVMCPDLENYVSINRPRSFRFRLCWRLLGMSELTCLAVRLGRGPNYLAMKF
jgi:hypothetical protein